MQAYVEDLRGFIGKELAAGGPTWIEDDVSLLDSGIIDSRSFVSLLDFIERRYQLQVEADAVDLECFDTILSIAKWISAQRNASDALRIAEMPR